jgi:hypothetical protein
MADLQFDEVKRRLKDGENLEVKTTGGTYEVWAEPYGNPPAVYYEGEVFAIEELDAICQKLLAAQKAGELSLRWAEME